MPDTLCDLIPESAHRFGDHTALSYRGATLDYDSLLALVRRVSTNFIRLGLDRGDRVAVFADKRPETIASIFGASHAGGVFVPINTLIKPRQVAYILNDCSVRFLVTTASRFAKLKDRLDACPSVEHIILIDAEEYMESAEIPPVYPWAAMVNGGGKDEDRRVISSDIASIMYTSGSTGMPKGVVLSHANMTIGAASVSRYLNNSSNDRILAALPLSFDAGFSQVTTGLYSGACVVLHDYLLASDIVRMIGNEQITGLTGVPPLWIQLSEQTWPSGSTESMRYFANTGGKMPRKTLERLRTIFTGADPYLMYGLTESFRSTYLPPSEVDRRPDSIGKAIPNVEVMVVNSDGVSCQPGEVGELVHRGPLVSLGYWNDPERTSHRFRPAPGQPAELPNAELAVWSGDSVKMDDEGYLYFVGRRDEMIKTSGYRVSPTEIEEIVHKTGLVSEVAALGVPHERLGQAIVIVAKSMVPGTTPTDELLNLIRNDVPNYMNPHAIYWKDSLPRNANGKTDRTVLMTEFADTFDDGKTP